LESDLELRTVAARAVPDRSIARLDHAVTEIEGETIPIGPWPAAGGRPRPCGHSSHPDHEAGYGDERDDVTCRGGDHTGLRADDPSWTGSPPSRREIRELRTDELNEVTGTGFVRPPVGPAFPSPSPTSGGTGPSSGFGDGTSGCAGGTQTVDHTGDPYAIHHLN